MRVKIRIKVDNKDQYVCMRSNQRLANSAGILEFNTWFSIGPNSLK